MDTAVREPVGVDKLEVVVSEHRDLTEFLDHDAQGRTFLATLKGYPQVADGTSPEVAMWRLLRKAGLGPHCIAVDIRVETV